MVAGMAIVIVMGMVMGDGDGDGDGGGDLFVDEFILRHNPISDSSI